MGLLTTQGAAILTGSKREVYVTVREEWATDKLLPVSGISYLIKSQKLLALVVSFLLREHSHPFAVLALEKYLSGLLSVL